MVNTVGLNKIDILSALGEAAQCVWEPVRPFKFSWNPIPNCWCSLIKGNLVIVDLRADDGFSEFWYDRALGPGAAQKAIDHLKLDLAGYHRYERNQKTSPYFKKYRKYPLDEADYDHRIFMVPIYVPRKKQ